MSHIGELTHPNQRFKYAWEGWQRGIDFINLSAGNGFGLPRDLCHPEIIDTKKTRSVEIQPLTQGGFLSLEAVPMVLSKCNGPINSRKLVQDPCLNMGFFLGKMNP